MDNCSGVGGRGFSYHPSRDESPPREEDDRDDDAMSEGSSFDPEDQWSGWKPLADPWVVLKDGEAIVSLFNRFNRDLIPWDRVRLKTATDGSKLFTFRYEQSKFAVFPRKLVSDRKRMQSFCSQFPHYCSGVEKEFCKDWIRGYGHVSVFKDDSVKPSDLPLSQEDMLRTFEAAGTNSSIKSETLKPSLIFLLSSFKELVGCLPVNKFSSDAVASDFGQQAKDLVSLSSDLASEEHTARLNLLSITVVLSAVHGFSVLAKNSVCPSALEAAGFSLMTGILPFLSFAWHQAYVRFCKTRTALPRSVFVQPIHHLATRLIISDPFSRTLFSKAVVKDVAKDFTQEQVTWSKLLKLATKVKKSGEKKSRPFRRPFFRAQYGGRGGQGGYSGGGRGHDGGRRGADRAFGRGRQSRNRGGRGRGNR